ncbi:uncharacterized protein LOC128674403 [Plodia interpunctella]|uniref:uncharacterized protein LOC128674403 n=1 Tax=Plodia interpunctella TaxID=58824 RepID=UPI002368647D|nr:uncharacterized protein LOC128674403 [Plodia interpunctella]
MLNEDQIRVMIQFMERHGDLRRSGDINNRLRIKKKWLELVTILNKIGEAKTLRQWSKVWSDTKYNTIKKYKNSLRGGPELTENDKVIMEILKSSQGQYGNPITSYDDQNASLEITIPNINISCDKPIKEEVREREEKRDLETSNQEEPRTEQMFYIVHKDEKRRHSVSSSASSSKSFTDDKTRERTEKSRRSSMDSVDKLSELADKFYELERERERLAHEREMARIQQHREFLTVMSRLVTVVESLAPSIKMYMDRNLNGGG